MVRDSVEFQKNVIITPFLVFIDYNRTFLIQLTGAVHPHVTFFITTKVVVIRLR